MQSERANVLPSLFSAMVDQQWDKMPSYFTESATWEVRPKSAVERFPGKGDFDVQQRIESFKVIRSDFLGDSAELKVNYFVQGDEASASRLSSRGTTRDGHPFEMEFIIFLEYEKGGSRIKRAIEMVDSAYLLDHINRMKGSSTNGGKA
ncbi:hypothetical protein JCM6882_007595 [Rhodosporidiobolus microsporus]